MHKITIRRTFNLGNYESLSVEGVGEDDDEDKARLLASKSVLEAAHNEIIRILNIRVANVTNSPYGQVVLELNGVSQELNRR